jgi:hypothetical protein
MKRNDMIVLVLVVSLTLVGSFLIIKTLFGDPKGKLVTVEKFESISSQLEQPSAAIFNKNAINPTVVIQIGSPANQQPFSNQ